VAYHETLWLAVAAAAPVIALANTVSIVDAASTWTESKQFSKYSLGRFRTQKFFTIISFIGSLNYTIQTITLFDALSSLGSGEDLMPPVVVVILMGLGLPLVLVIVMYSVSFRFALKYEDHLDKGEGPYP
jgi:hypothetical protein